MKNYPTIIFYYRKANTYALNVLLGALGNVNADYRVNFDFVKSVAELKDAISTYGMNQNPILICWSFYSPDYFDCLEELKEVRRSNNLNRASHLVGGVHATAESEATLRAGFDYVAIGEGEKTIIQVAKSMESGQPLNQLQGIGYLSNDDKFISNGSGERIDLNEFPPFSLHLKKFNPIEITRGCVYACKFCQTPFMFKAKFRHRSIENICQYVRIMKDRGLKDIRFISPTSLSYGSYDKSVNLDAIEKLLHSVRQIIGSEGRIFFGSFPSEVRPEHVSPQALRLLKKYVDNDNIIIGAQSGSNRILDSSKRGHNVDSIKKAIEISIDEGFLPNVDFIFGLPGETQNDVNLSLDLAEELSECGARIHGHTFMPLPGTPYKNSPGGTISKSTEKRISRLTSRGKLYGQWKKQISTARNLESLQNFRKHKAPNNLS